MKIQTKRETNKKKCKKLFRLILSFYVYHPYRQLLNKNKNKKKQNMKKNELCVDAVRSPQNMFNLSETKKKKRTVAFFFVLFIVMIIFLLKQFTFQLTHVTVTERIFIFSPYI